MPKTKKRSVKYTGGTRRAVMGRRARKQSWKRFALGHWKAKQKKSKAGSTRFKKRY